MKTYKISGIFFGYLAMIQLTLGIIGANLNIAIPAAMLCGLASSILLGYEWERMK